MKLDQLLQRQSGLSWVLSRLDPLSALGKNRARALPWYEPSQVAELEQELDNVAVAMELATVGHPALIPLTTLLPQMKDIRASLDGGRTASLDLVELFQLKEFLLQLERLIPLYQGLPPMEGIVFSAFGDLLTLFDPTGRKIPQFVIDSSYHPDLPLLRQQRREVEKHLATCAPREKEELHLKRAQLWGQEEEVERVVRATLTEKIMAQAPALLENMEQVARLDVTLAKGRLAKAFGCVRPSLTSDTSLTLEGLIHPEIGSQVTEREGEFTPVDVTLVEGCTVITGANMGGKSVSLQSVTLSILLTQLGFFLFATKGVMPLYEGVALLLADRVLDGGGLSSFATEVDTLNTLLGTMKEGRFFLAVDEFARGTNPQEGAQLARGLATHLSKLPCTALMTTHYDGVAQGGSAHYQVAGLTKKVEGDEGDAPKTRIASRMDYRLLPAPKGADCPKDAMAICQLLGIDESLFA